jgi:pimeloyl-ACP methyl ester carboxylesterase
VPVLVEAGFRVACFDAPSHGANPGRKAHLIQFCESLYAIQDRLGPIECVIAHSLGAMATVYASQHRLSVRRLVLVAPHLDVQQMFETFRDLLGMRAALGQRFHDKIGARMRTILDQQDPWATLNPQAMLCDAGYPGLLVYDRQDPEVSQAQFDSISQCWQAARVLTTDGLGHNRILKDAQVIRAIRDYLKS